MPRMGVLSFEVAEEQGTGHYKTFIVHARTGDRTLGVGHGKNKKLAEQRASEDALIKMKVDLSTGEKKK